MSREWADSRFVGCLGHDSWAVASDGSRQSTGWRALHSVARRLADAVESCDFGQMLSPALSTSVAWRPRNTRNTRKIGSFRVFCAFRGSHFCHRSTRMKHRKAWAATKSPRAVRTNRRSPRPCLPRLPCPISGRRIGHGGHGRHGVERAIADLRHEESVFHPCPSVAFHASHAVPTAVFLEFP